MKYFYPFFIVMLLLIWGCKKDSKNNSVNHLATLKANVTGKWYYNSYEVTYYDSGHGQIYNDVATPAILYNNAHYDFRTNDIGFYTGFELPDDHGGFDSITYTVKNEGGADSLIVQGSHPGRFKIVSISADQLNLQSDYPSSEIFVNKVTGAYITASSAESFGTFSRNRAPQP